LYRKIGLEEILFTAGPGQSHEKCIIVVCGITAAAIENPIGSASEPIFGDANHKNLVACAPGYCPGRII
jgi:hypothetical protein